MLLEAIQAGLAISMAFAVAFLVYRMIQLYELFQRRGPRDAVMGKTFIGRGEFLRVEIVGLDSRR